MLKRGKKCREWDAARKKLKRIFEFDYGVVACEVCGSTFGLSFAHRLKRRFITTPEELLTTALLCAVHHDEYERLPHQEMYDAITKIIEQREVRQ